MEKCEVFILGFVIGLFAAAFLMGLLDAARREKEIKK